MIKKIKINKKRKCVFIFFLIFFILLSISLIIFTNNYKKSDIDFRGFIGNVEVFNIQNVDDVISKPQFYRCSEIGNYYYDSNLENINYSCSYIFQIKLDKEGMNNFLREINNLHIVKEKLSQNFTIKFNNTEISTLSLSKEMKTLDPDNFNPTIMVNDLNKNQEIAKNNAMNKANIIVKYID